MSFPALHVLGSSTTIPVANLTREQVCRVKTSGMQGLTVVTQQFGTLPWWDAALPWLSNPSDRQAVYAAKRAKGDTHQLIELPSGVPLYNETEQSYSPDRFGPLDWTNGNTQISIQLIELLHEVLANGFIPVLFLNGDDGERGYHIATKQLPLVVAALGDLMKATLIIPGWDGVFYGYTPEHIVAFGQLFRTLSPNGYLAIEMSEGHIPLGEGASDWTPTGRMDEYDTLLVEFNPDNVHQDSTWQISGRLLGPAYKRPADEPVNDDPRPPMYLEHSPRGPYYPIAFEVNTFHWVRGLGIDKVNNDLAYLRSLGWSV